MVNDVPIAPVEREPKDALAQILVDDVRDEREVLQVARSLGQPQGGVPCELNELGSHHQHVAELPLALSDARILGGLRLEAVLPALIRVEVADILVVRVPELEDIEDEVELLVFVHEVVVVEGDVDGVLEGRRVVARVVVGGGEADDGLCDGRGAVGLSMMHMFDQIVCMLFVLSDRRPESRSWMSPSPKDWRKMSKEIRHGFCMS